MDDKTLEQLQQENAELTGKLQDAEAELELTKEANAVLTAKLQQGTTDLNGKLQDMETELESTKEINEELTAKVEELSAKVSLGAAAEQAQAEEKPVLPTETFEVDGAKYRFTTPVFVFDGKKVLASQAMNDTAILSQLVAKGSGVITKA
jgi:predicted nuclease with TOPRIM domain